MKSMILAGAITALATVAPADAARMVLTVDARDFTGGIQNEFIPPHKTITGSFSFDIDLSNPVDQSGLVGTAQMTVDGAAFSPRNLDYSFTSGGRGDYFLGVNGNGDGPTGFSFSFGDAIENTKIGQANGFFFYSTKPNEAGFTGLYVSRAAVTIAYDGGYPVVPLPEPANWALMVIGFGAAGVALRRRGSRPAIA